MTLDELTARLAKAFEAGDDAPNEIQFAVLFGSAVRRGPDHARDIDVAVSFRTPPSWLERGALANRLEAAIGRPVDLIDLSEASTVLRWQVASTGRPVSIRDRAAWLAFQTLIPMEHADLLPYFERESEGLRRALSSSRWSR